jgi:hypothetical protein
MDDTASFSSRGNAKRAAEQMISKGTAPALDYGIKPRDDGRFEIAWKTAEAKASPTTTDEVEAELAAAIEEAEANWSEAGEAEAASITETPSTVPPTADASEEDIAQTAAQADPGANGGESSLPANDPAECPSAATAPPPATAEPENPWPEGTRVMVRNKGKSWSEATMVRRLDADYWRVEYPGGGSGVLQEADIRAYDDARDAKPARQSRRARETAPRAPRAQTRSRYAIDPAVIVAGKLPDKAPVVSSATNQLYQKKFDALHAHAVAGEWDAVRDFKITGSNSYSKMVERYRQDLLAVHKAQETATEQAPTGQC